MKATTILLMMFSLSGTALAQSPSTPPELPADMQPQLQPPLEPPMPPQQPETHPPMQMPPQMQQAPSPTQIPSGATNKSVPSSGPISVQPKTENGFTTLCGGVGLDESTYMKRAAKNYDVMSTFAARGGNYLADVKLDISDKSGKSTLQTTCDGPILLIKFPRAGTYRIRADVGGNVQTKTAQIQGKHGVQTMVFVWSGG
ncbi:hypothetical protein [Paraherbaspirillum soli]|uniref:Carboxypeptidase regulatory-like domain-containing protein n=1 Tax=Paraherbaspirillum soli TaxID=631222 RepID=A0ABW0MDV3_9BURK